MSRVAFLIPWLCCFVFLQFGFPGRSKGAEFFRVFPRMGAPGVLWTQTEASWFSKRNPFSPIRDAGGNHFVTVTGEWVTVSDSGTVHLQPFRFPFPVVAGGNYLVDPSSRRILAVDAWGYPVDSQIEVGDLRAVGWNWLITGEGVLVTVRKSGVAPGDGSGMVIRKAGWDFSDVRIAGGTFLVRGDGRVVTVSEITGFFREWPPIGQGIRWAGGNHLVDGESRLWTVDEDGTLQRTDLEVQVLPEIHGKGWLRFPGGGVWVIDSRGRVSEKIQLVIAGRGADPSRSFYEPIDPVSVFRSWIGGDER